MSEEQAQELLYQMQILESYYSEIIQKENSLLNVLKDSASAIESLKQLGGSKESETLAPVGIGVFVKSKISSDDKFLLNIGAGIAMEKDKASTINFLENRIKEIEVALQETNAQKQHIVSQLEQGKMEINRLAQSVPKNKQ